MKRNEKGFTLMEMLIVVAIIAVLVAIAIPVFNNQLEKSREAVDMANLRAAYAEVLVAANTDMGSDGTGAASADATKNVLWSGGNNPYWYKQVAATQAQSGWQSTAPNIGGYTNVQGITKEKKWVVKLYRDGTLEIGVSVGATG